MQAIGIVLLLISIGTIVGPIGAVVVMYRDNLPGLVITPQIRDMMNGNSTILPFGTTQITTIITIITIQTITKIQTTTQTITPTMAVVWRSN